MRLAVNSWVGKSEYIWSWSKNSHRQTVFLVLSHAIYSGVSYERIEQMYVIDSKLRNCAT